MWTRAGRVAAQRAPRLATPLGSSAPRPTTSGACPWATGLAALPESSATRPAASPESFAPGPAAPPGSFAPGPEVEEEGKATFSHRLFLQI